MLKNVMVLSLATILCAMAWAQDPQVTIHIEGLNSSELLDAGIDTGPSSGLSNVGVGTYVYLTAEASNFTSEAITYNWTLETPNGSASGFIDFTVKAFDPLLTSAVAFVPDVVGSYTVSVSADDGMVAQPATASQTITARKWVGAGIVNKTDPASSNITCAGCHNGSFAPDKVTPWLTTGHATYFARAIDGEVSDPNPEEVNVGYDPNATNDGFDDFGWMKPATFEPGNWDALVAGNADAARRANIQCENCHGPAQNHLPDYPAVSLSADVCGQCHPQEAQWRNSGHSDAASTAFTYPIGATHTACVRCHSGVGYIDFINGVVEAERRTDMQVHTCAVCHDPHGNTHDAQLRNDGSVSLPGDTTPRTGLGAAATCMNCHNGRITPDEALNGSFPHHSTASEAWFGINYASIEAGDPNDINGDGNLDAVDVQTVINGALNLAIQGDADVNGDGDVNAVDVQLVINAVLGAGGKSGEKAFTISNSYHAGNVTCVQCHMATAAANGAVGEHSFMMSVDEGAAVNAGLENVANACGGCHPNLTTFNREAGGDFDGDGTVEGVQDEVSGLLGAVLTLITTDTGLVHLDAYPYWDFTAVSTAQLPSLQKAVWNYTLILSEGSLGVHNTKYSVGVLQQTYKAIAGTDVPNADIL